VQSGPIDSDGRTWTLITDPNLGTRKLACSKDPEGCERCKRENIICHYSEQKPYAYPGPIPFVLQVCEAILSSDFQYGKAEETAVHRISK
jgi:hypothetical protein